MRVVCGCGCGLSACVCVRARVRVGVCVLFAFLGWKLILNPAHGASEAHHHELAPELAFEKCVKVSLGQTFLSVCGCVGVWVRPKGVDACVFSSLSSGGN